MVPSFMDQINQGAEETTYKEKEKFVNKIKT